jgi:hypothetical protein
MVHRLHSRYGPMTRINAIDAAFRVKFVKDYRLADDDPSRLLQ